MNDKKQLEERPYYQKVAAAAQKMGLDLIVFTPQDVSSVKRQINAHIYDLGARRWTRRWTRFPDLIFDRGRVQASYRFKQLKQFRAKYRSPTYLNHPLRNKWGIHQTLSSNTDVRPHLPPSVLFKNEDQLSRYLNSYELVFIKPVNGTGGRGILCIEKLRSNQFLLQGRDKNRRVISPKQLSLQQLTKTIQSKQLYGNHILQRGIRIKLGNGRVHDYRMLIQRNGNGEWEVTGCAGRIGAKDSVTSNLHGGGEASSMNSLLQQWIQDDAKRAQVKQSAEKLAHQVAKHLEQEYGRLCELALDLAVDRSGHVWLLEVNPKPAREVFRQAGEIEVYHKSIVRPLEFALWLNKRKRAKAGKESSSSES